VERGVDEAAVAAAVAGLRARGIESVAVCLLHAYGFPAHEEQVGRVCEAGGFSRAAVSLSSRLSPVLRAVPRGHTAVVDAYLTPGIRAYLDSFRGGFAAALRGVDVSFMQSDGGLTPAEGFCGFKAVLSGPAGGVVGYSRTAYGRDDGAASASAPAPLIGFDMGGTSTDVSRYAGHLEQVFETTTAGVAIQAPQLDIHTVAAGGGSALAFENGAFRVGPDSVGAEPGPVCYRKRGGRLAVTDANLVLGRVQPEWFPKIFGPGEDLPLDVDGARRAFEALAAEIRAHQATPGVEALSVEEAALGFLRVANESMARPIRELTEMKGYEPGRHELACFGGAGPQHACALAAGLGMRRVHVHRYAGILSAYGMGLADVVAERRRPVGGGGAESALVRLSEASDAALGAMLGELGAQVRAELAAQGFAHDDDVHLEEYLNLRYEGTETATMTPRPPGATPRDVRNAFVAAFRREYGFDFGDRALLVDDARVRGVGRTPTLASRRVDRAAAGEEGAPPPAEAFVRVYFEGGWSERTPLVRLEAFLRGHALPGPAIVMNGTCTVVVEPGWSAHVTDEGDMLLERTAFRLPLTVLRASDPVDPVQLAIFGNRFMGIAEQMGRTLQRTSISTNIKERLDFSCAVFGPDGGLVANAPHIPVHLGSMGLAVASQMAMWAEDLREGDVLMTNHPRAGGTHLPDITVVTPVFRDGRVVFIVASRGHHADIGGITPGSMPPFSRELRDEGAAIKGLKLVERGIFQEDAVTRALRDPDSLREEPGEKQPQPQPQPRAQGTRKLADNLSDLKAQVAANQRGIALIQDLCDAYGLDVVQAYMGHLQDNAAACVRAMLRLVPGRLRDSPHAERIEDSSGQATVVALTAEDFMDDGTPIKLRLTVDGERGTADFDFSGTGPHVYGNTNAPRAVTYAAVIYCLRLLIGTDIPLNQGCLAPVTVRIPESSLLDPGEACAVVGGNVLTSQRVTDVVLQAFRACADFQGCMNNLTFGDATFGYYETIAGGAGAGPGWDGQSGVQCHMTNTRITDPEILERRYPVVLRRFALRRGSGGRGAWKGGDGVVRELEFRRPLTVSILSERRTRGPKGCDGAEDGAPGLNLLQRAAAAGGGREGPLNIGGKNTINVGAGDVLTICTPGGGGWGPREAPRERSGGRIES